MGNCISEILSEMNPERVVFIGSKQFGLNMLKQIHAIHPDSLKGVITLDDSKDPRSVLDKFKQFCTSENILITILKNKRMFNKTIQLYNPELCIVACWYWLINKETLESVKHGFIGLHHSALPQYRGGSPLVWQIINGETRIGSSIFTLKDGIDSGPIWYTAFITVYETDSIRDILERLETRILSWVKENYTALLNHEIDPYPQIEKNVSYCAQRFPKDGKIDWTKNANEIHNFIRAQSHPYPGAFTHYRDKKLIIWKTRLTKIKTYYGTPGQVAQVTNEGVSVICGDNKPIMLLDVQLEGEPLKPANKVLKSFKVRLC